MRILCMVAVVVCIVLIIYGGRNVPLSTRVSSGRFNHYGDGVAMPIALALPVINIYFLWQGTRGSRARRMRSTLRKVLYVLGPLMIAGGGVVLRPHAAF